MKIFLAGASGVIGRNLIPRPAADWLPAYAAAIGAPPPPQRPGIGGGLRGAENTRARKELGWEPWYPSWREGFRNALG
jgi:nucleoside-diphosphate-sugar epimerase